jgi:hypothetical protein
MGSNRHNFWESLTISDFNENLKSEPNIDMNLLNNDFINMNYLNSEGATG